MEFRANEVFTGPMPHGFTWGLVLLKDLTKTPIPIRTYMSEKLFGKYIEDFVDPMPHGFIWGLVLLNDLPKPPIPVRTYMSENCFESILRILWVQCLMGLYGV